jgi:hypothetical protein
MAVTENPGDAHGVPHPVDRRNVLMVSTSYPSDLADWRGVFIRHMVGALSRREDLALRLWAPPGELPDRTDPATTPDEARWLADLMAAGGIAHLIRTQRVRGISTAARLLLSLRRLYRRESTAAVFHVNWLQNALVLPNDGRPVLATVLGSDMQLLKLPGMTAWLRRVFRARRSVICPNAEWMVPLLETRFGDAAEIRFVPFGIDPRWFSIQREPVLPHRWLCVSRLTEGKIGSLFSWGERWFGGGERELHLFGPMQQSVKVPEWVHYHGPATPESLCSEWFPSAQGLITLSRHAEGRPQVMLEAMAAGLPVIASRIAAHEDMLRHQVTGWLCDSEAGLGDALAALGRTVPNRDLGLRAREWTLTNIGTWDDCAQRYSDIYTRLIGG